MKRAFTLIELLVVIAIIAIIAAIIFPVFTRAKAKAKQTQCISNLSQVGKAMLMYMADNDDLFPYAVDASDKYAPDIWGASPEYQAQIAAMPMMHEALADYVKGPELFKCPSDNGTYVLDNHAPLPFVSTPTSYKVYGMSYFYRTEIAFKGYSQTRFEEPTKVNVMFDAAGHWHGTKPALREDDDEGEIFSKWHEYRYNTLFGDMHAKSLSRSQLQEAWDIEL